MEALKIKNRYNLFALVTIIFLAFGSSIYTGHYAFAQTNQTASKLQAANTAVNQAFNAVLDAEKAGANVNGSIIQLNIAEGILAQAENSYRTGDFNASVAQADKVIPIAQEVSINAQDAKQTALVSGSNAFWFALAFTGIGSIIFVLALFLVWRRFKRHYIIKLHEAQPEVANP